MVWVEVATKRFLSVVYVGLDEGTGAGVYSEEMAFDISIPLGTFPTVYQSEILATLESSERLLSKNLTNKKILIYSDSESSIKALSSYKISSKLVNQCMTTLENLSEHNDVSLIWVPGHSGIPGNERGDELAGKGSSERFLGPEPALGNCVSNLTRLVKSETEKKHQDMWDNLETCAQA